MEENFKFYSQMCRKRKGSKHNFTLKQTHQPYHHQNSTKNLTVFKINPNKKGCINPQTTTKITKKENFKY